MKIYIVEGWCWDTADCNEHWLVAAYFTKEAAELHRSNADLWWQQNKERFDPERWTATPVNENPWDRWQHIAYESEGTVYKVKEIDLYDHPDQFIEEQEAAG
jgi:hypothetical protein